jgi:nitric oxide reductase subunit B
MVAAQLIVMLFGFACQIPVTTLSYRNAPSIPTQVIDAQARSCSALRISAMLLKYGLLDNGNISDHGAYLGSDVSATTLHRMGLATAEPSLCSTSASRWKIPSNR